MEPTRKTEKEITLNFKIQKNEEQNKAQNSTSIREDKTNRSYVVNLTEKLPFTIKIY